MKFKKNEFIAFTWWRRMFAKLIRKCLEWTDTAVVELMKFKDKPNRKGRENNK